MASTTWTQTAGMTSDEDVVNVETPEVEAGVTWTQTAGMVSDEDVDNLESYAEQALASKNAAAASETAAATSEANAATSETNAATSETNAATSETNAATSETAAATSATNAATSATSASTSATSAASSATAAAASETAAAASETAAAASETASAASETAAAASETAAASSENAAATSETNAATSETNAATSASTASTAATNAATSETNAATSASNAATSETNAATSETNAATSATNAATSETNAASSASSASTSATNAASSASSASASQTAAASSETAAASSASTASTASTTATTKASEASTSAANAATSETNAATSETNAATSASNASTSATAAASSASSASTSASNASTSASAAATSASNASASADAALAALDNFDDRYLGQKASDPTVDNDGDALVAGALYFNTTDDAMKVYDGSTWVAAYASLSGALLSANNFSDLADAATARTNLGVAIGTDVQAYSAVLAGTTASYTTAEATKLAGIEAGATADQSASEILTAIKTVDGTGSGLDADTLDGQEATAFATAAQGTAADAALPKAGGTMTGALNFGDNVKAQFGASSDLQIYHDGFSSRIKDAGTGNLIIEGENVVIDGANGNRLASFVSGGRAELQYDGSEKLRTTSTGIDVTGTVTADGLTVDAGASDALITIDAGTAGVSNSDAKLQFVGSTAASGVAGYGNIYLDVPSGGKSDMYFQTAPSGGSGGQVNRLKLAGNGDISFYEDTGTTAKFFWDASASSVGIGNAAPDGNLTVGDTSTSGDISIRIKGDATSRGFLMFGDNGGAQLGDIMYDHSDNHMRFRVNNSEAMRIDSSGNVGIGTSTTTGGNTLLDLHKSGYGVGTQIRFANDHSTGYYVGLAGNTVGEGIIWNESNAGMLFGTNNSERMRIDSSGNLLVGKTAINSNVAGFEVDSDGKIAATRDASQVAIFNRLTDDGDIVTFRKDGTTVGSIGTGSGRLSIGNIDTGLEFVDGLDAILPHNMTTNGNRDAAIDFGYPTQRFKDLYLSGNAYINGGTAWHSGNDGSGSGLDADTLDGIDSASFLRSDASDTMTGSLTVSATGGSNIIVKDSNNSGTAAAPWIQFQDSANADLGYVGIGSSGSNDIFLYTNNGNPVLAGGASSVAKVYKNGTYYDIWHSGNDGSGSGLDADLLDGNHASAFALASHSHSYVQSVRLGSISYIGDTSDVGYHKWVGVSAGHLMAGYQAMWGWGDDMIGGLSQRPVQIQINGSWYTVSSV